MMRLVKEAGRRRPARSLRAAGWAALGLLMVAAPAHAQFFGAWNDEPDADQWGAPAAQSRAPLSSAAVRRVLAGRQLRLLRPLFRNGETYVADVLDAKGGRQRLVLDAYQGSVLQATRVEASRSYDDDSAASWPSPYDDFDRLSRPHAFGYLPDDTPPIPSRPIPNGRFAHVLPDPGQAIGSTARASVGTDSTPAVVPGIGPSETPADETALKAKHQVRRKAPRLVSREPGEGRVPPLAPVTSAPLAAAPLASEPARVAPPLAVAPLPAPAAVSAAPPAPAPEAPAPTQAAATASANPAPAAEPPAPSRRIAIVKKPAATFNDIPPAPLD